MQKVNVHLGVELGLFGSRLKIFLLLLLGNIHANITFGVTIMFIAGNNGGSAAAHV